MFPFAPPRSGNVDGNSEDIPDRNRTSPPGQNRGYCDSANGETFDGNSLRFSRGAKSDRFVEESPRLHPEVPNDLEDEIHQSNTVAKSRTQSQSGSSLPMKLRYSDLSTYALVSSKEINPKGNGKTEPPRFPTFPR